MRTDHLHATPEKSWEEVAKGLSALELVNQFAHYNQNVGKLDAYRSDIYELNTKAGAAFAERKDDKATLYRDMADHIDRSAKRFEQDEEQEKEILSALSGEMVRRMMLSQQIDISRAI